MPKYVVTLSRTIFTDFVVAECACCGSKGVAVADKHFGLDVPGETVLAHSQNGIRVAKARVHHKRDCLHLQR